jgi:hypothetical protein
MGYCISNITGKGTRETPRTSMGTTASPPPPLPLTRKQANEKNDE